jgi:hypothetical protein
MDVRNEARIARRAPLAGALGLALLALAAPAQVSPCGDADGSAQVTATDALLALASSVGVASPCDGNCNCDVDGSRALTATDALMILRASIGLEEIGCIVVDECFQDEDCDPGFYCGGDPVWDCDAACVP